MAKKKNPIAVGQINLSKPITVKLQEGDGASEGSLHRRSLLIFEGEFMGMFGPVKVTRELLEIMVARFNRHYANPKNIHDFPPLLVDHNALADNIKGRLVPELVLEDWENPRTGDTVAAVFGDIRVDDSDAKVKVIEGKYSQLSISFDDDIDNIGEIFELSFVAVDATRGSQVLGKGHDMKTVEQLQASLDKSKLALKKARRSLKEGRKVRLAAYATLAKNAEAIASDSISVGTQLADSIKSLKTNVLRSQMSGFVREGRLSKAEFDKIDLDEVVKMESKSQRIYLSSFANRPVSSDIVQHGMTGAEPLNDKGLKLSGAALRKAMKAQRSGEDYDSSGKPTLASDDGDNPRDDDNKDKDGPTDLTMDDIEDALTKLEGLASMAEKLKEAGARMQDTLSKLKEGDEEENDDEEGDE